MATKDKNKFKSRTFVNSKFTADIRLKDLNLNQNNSFSKDITVQSVKNSTDNRSRKLLHDDYSNNEKVENKGFSLWKKEVQESIKKNMSDPDKKFHKHVKKEDLKMSVNSSTLSLHIAAYENSVETNSVNLCDGENTKDLKTVINIAATPTNQVIL
uniref:Uncharacterized protein n=1 Tax=Panagrolaimus sp. ES5 TaxID=591445 RepID=A0AC34GH95_9BILA